MRIGESEERLGYNGYRKLAGEVEARNVSERMGKTMEERRASLRTDTQDVADEDQIFIYEGLEGANEVRTMFSFAKTPAEFDAIQKEAVAQKGIVLPGLSEANIDIVDVERHNFEGTGNEAIQKAKEWASENIVGEHIAKFDTADEFTYTIDDKSIKKYLSSAATRKSENLGVHLSVLKRLPDVIDKSIEAEIHADYKKTDGRSTDNGVDDKNLLIHRFYGCVRLNNELHRIKVTLKEKKSEGVKPYSYEVTKIELLSGSSQNGTSWSDALNNSISSAKLLENVEKSYDKGVKLLEVSENSSRTMFSAVPGSLIATHNLTAAGLAHAAKMGGLPNPSMAVNNSDVGSDDF